MPACIKEDRSQTLHLVGTRSLFVLLQQGEADIIRPWPTYGSNECCDKPKCEAFRQQKIVGGHCYAILRDQTSEHTCRFKVCNKTRTPAIVPCKYKLEYNYYLIKQGVQIARSGKIEHCSAD